MGQGVAAAASAGVAKALEHRSATEQIEVRRIGMSRIEIRFAAWAGANPAALQPGNAAFVQGLSATGRPIAARCFVEEQREINEDGGGKQQPERRGELPDHEGPEEHETEDEQGKAENARPRQAAF